MLYKGTCILREVSFLVFMPSNTAELETYFSVTNSWQSLSICLYSELYFHFKVKRLITLFCILTGVNGWRAKIFLVHKQNRPGTKLHVLLSETRHGPR